MIRFFTFLFLLSFGCLHAQEQVVHSVYFEFDKFNLDVKQAESVVGFIKATESARIESISIYGYCDDRGKDAYNFKLSNNRATTIQNKLIENGIKNKIIVTIEGKGRVLIDDDIVENLPEVRSKNRRVDVVINFKELPKEVIVEGNGIYNTLSKDLKVGDRIFLNDLLFARGSSKLTITTKNELDKVARLLHKYKNYEFEIQGHVCCTPPYQREAIDMDTKKRQLSSNRAENVYKYFILKRIAKNRMKFKGYGTTQPLGKESEYDRRVELVITKI